MVDELLIKEARGCLAGGAGAPVRSPARYGDRTGAIRDGIEGP
jgi:hypothetical protein